MPDTGTRDAAGAAPDVWLELSDAVGSATAGVCVSAAEITASGRAAPEQAFGSCWGWRPSRQMLLRR